MKFQLSLLGLFLSLTLTNCEKGSDEAKPATAQMSAKIDGVYWAADKSAGAQLTQNILTISGLSLDNQSVTLTLEGVAGAGYYEFNDGVNHTGSYTPDQNSSSFFTSTANASPLGTIIISDLNWQDSLISGVFKFEATLAATGAKVVVNEGEFTDLPITAKNPPRGNNSLSVKIDGVLFTPASVRGSVRSGKLTITGIDNADLKSVSLQMPQTITAGAYDFDGSSIVGQYNPNGTVSANASIGKLTISQHDLTARYVEGKFEFSTVSFGAPAGLKLSEGKFSVTY